MTDRQRMFDYLDGVADGLNESRNDVADVLDKIRAEIEREADYQDAYVNADVAKGMYLALEIIDKKGE